MQKKQWFNIIICITILLSLLTVISYAYFASQVETSNLETNVSLEKNNIIFTSTGTDNINMQITNADLSQVQENEVAKTSSSTISVSLLAGSTKPSICTYDIMWNWNETDMIENRYTKTLGALKEYTISGNTINDSFPETQVLNYDNNNLKTFLHRGVITNESVNSATIQNWDLDINFYNLAIEQYDVFLGTYKSSITIENVACTVQEFSLNSFVYTSNDYKTFSAPLTGTYQIELWGAQGGDSYITGNNLYHGGYGGYTSGMISLTKNELLYLYLGGKGQRCMCRTSQNCCGENAGFNGGGKSLQYTGGSTYYGSGGGATDVRLVDGNWNNASSLNSRIMVAGGGGGASNYREANVSAGYNYLGGAGGGLTGKVGTMTRQDRNRGTCTGGTQSSSGIGTYNGNASFAIGGLPQSLYGPGGGGGYYGGGTGETFSCGGSSYISGHAGSIAIEMNSESLPNRSVKTGCSASSTSVECSIHYSEKRFTNTQIIDGDGNSWKETISTPRLMPNPKGGYFEQGTGNIGSGYAKISLVYFYNSTGGKQDFVAPMDGKYKVELWGAQGGDSYIAGEDNIYRGGYGGYTYGEIELNQGDSFFVYVGGSGSRCQCTSSRTCCGNNGGYNGGANAYQYTGGSTYYGSGGGATDIRLVDGNWNNDASLNSRIMVAGGGGGASNWQEDSQGGYNFIGGNGGGLEGKVGSYTRSDRTHYCTGGTQTSGGLEYGATGVGFGPGSYRNGYGPGGGGGYYGGGTSETYSCGGSSYISGHIGSISIKRNSYNPVRDLKDECETNALSQSCSIHYEGTYFTKTKIIDGDGYAWTTTIQNQEAMPDPYGGFYPIGKGHVGDGVAKITLIN